MLVYKLSIALLVFFFNSLIGAQQNKVHQECVFPKPIEPILPDVYLTEERVIGLDAFWAQEYVGADLLRKRLEEAEGIKEATSDLVQIWDGNNNRHGEYASNIIAGPFPSAVIPQPNPIDVTEASKITGANAYEYLYRYDYEYLYKQCRREGNCPHYISNSMNWGSYITKEVFYTMNRREGTTISTSAGDTNRYLSKLKGGLEQLNRLIVVTNIDPLGNPSRLSNYSINTTISAPADDMIRSYDLRGNPHNFGGSSGALPLVKGTFISFTLITDYPLNTKQQKHLLKKTAIHFPNLPSSNSMGYGILNAYKIGEVGFKLNEICQNESKYNQCISSHINFDSTYEFHLEEEKKTALRDARRAFPTCFSENHIPSNSATCEDKHNVLERLRQIAFLDSSDKRFWQIISCVKRESGLTKHAEFYERLTERLDMSDEDIIRHMIENQDYELLLKYAISIENLSQIIMPILNDRSMINKFLTIALRSLEDILQYYEDVPNLEGILTKAIRHDNADTPVFFAVNDIITDNFSKISNAEDILRYNINRQDTLLPTLAISNNLDKLSDPEVFLRILLNDERITGVDLIDIIDDDLIRHRQSLTHFREFLDEIIHHEKSNGEVIQYVFMNIIEDYNNIPDAKDISTPLINSDKLDGEHLGRMAKTLIRNYDQSPDFKAMLRSIIDSPQANSQTLSDIIYSLIQNSESFEDFDQFLSTTLHHEKADETTVNRASIAFIRYYSTPSNMTEIFELIINNQHIAIACFRVAYTIVSEASPNSNYYKPTITYIPQKLELIYSHCDNKINVEDLNSIKNSIRQNTLSQRDIPNTNAIELNMLRFILRQDAIDESLLNSIMNFIPESQATDEVRREINQLIQEALQKILDRQNSEPNQP